MNIAIVCSVVYDVISETEIKTMEPFLLCKTWDQLSLLSTHQHIGCSHSLGFPRHMDYIHSCASLCDSL